ncbi:MAG: alpha-L-fucosidase, partial [Armatimonadetes bacterium]|nr:alpha-L-fucosidase [Armatimonadota bacterium]
DVFFGIHYDLHAKATDTELGRELTPEHLRQRLELVRPDWIQCDCKGHAGYTSWPTEVGSPSPGIAKDALRIHRDVTKELGIKLGMHYSGVWDSRAIELHPDWACLGADGQPNDRMTCRLSGYDDELMIPQMLELVEKYDVDGFWVDGENWGATACWCDRCRAEFTRRTGLAEIPASAEDAHWAAWLAFHRDLFTEHVAHYADAVHAVKPDCLICSNWMYTVRQPEPIAAPVDYLSGDYDPIWGSTRAAVEGRVLDARGLTWDLMAWGFTRVYDGGGESPWVFKPVVHLCQELVEVVALGGAVMIYNQPQRTGWLTGWHQERIAAPARFCRERQAACFRSQTVPQAAVLHLAEHYYTCNAPLFNYGDAIQPVEGALHSLLENHLSTDILLQEHLGDRLAEYKLAVLPEQTHLSADTIAALEQYVAAGGHVIASGAHLSQEAPEFVGATPAGETQALAYLRSGEEVLPVTGPWQPVAPAEGMEIIARRMAQQEPSKDETDEVIVTRRRVGQGSVTAIHGPFFRQYLRAHYPSQRRLMAQWIADLQIPWLVTLDASPRLELILRRQGERLVVNLINRGAGEMTSPNRIINEELLPERDVKLRVRLDAAPRSVTSVPEGEVAWEYGAGQLEVSVPEVLIHTAIVVEP